MTENILKTYLICDESGFKGFSDKTTSQENDIGVFAGYCISETSLYDIRNIANYIANKYKNSDGKTHITDLSIEKQMNLRKEVFDVLLQCKGFYFIYEAIHHNGFCKYYQNTQQFIKEHKIMNNQRFAISNHMSKYRLHTKLFQSLFAKALELLLFLQIDKFEIIVLTDNIETKIINEFKNSIEEFLNINYTKNEVTIYDKIDKKIKKIIIESGLYGMYNYRNNLKNYEIKNVTDENKNLVLIADIIANSILYYLSQNPSNQDLNSIDAIKEHPLYKCLYNPCDVGWINDNLYKI